MMQNPVLLVLLPLGLASLGGSIPHLLERLRRRSIEKALPEVLESISVNIGAGLGLEQAMAAIPEIRNDKIGKMISKAIVHSQSTTFDAALAEFAIHSRSKMVQRVINLLATARAQDAPLEDITFKMSMEYDRLNKLMNKRESELQGRALLIQIFIAMLLPAIIAAMFGTFAPPTAGYAIRGVLNSLSLFFGVSAGVTTIIGGRMLGRGRASLWYVPMWVVLSMLTFDILYLGIGTSIGG
jgi:hypothetical protein